MPEQTISIPVDREVTLEGAFTPAAHPSRGGGLVLHPHPQYGGSMHNNVVETLLRALTSQGMAGLRFNFRGVGASTGQHDQGRAEQEDVLAAAAWLAERQPGPLVILGYSFGSLVGAAAADRIKGLIAGVWAAPPLIMGPLPPWPRDAGPLLAAAGDRDQFTRLDELRAYMEQLGARGSLEILKQVDHFFMGGESVLFEKVSHFLADLPGLAD